MSDKFAIYGSDVSQSKDGIANGLRETAGPTNLAAGEIVDGEYLVRSGNKIISAAVSAVTGPATQIIETNGPTTLTIAGIVDGEFLKRSGATVISANAGAAALTPGAANTVFVTNGAATSVITALLVNANVDAAAAIAVTKLAAGSNGTALVTTAGVPTWSAPGGDLSGTYPSPAVSKINGATVPAGGALTTGNGLYVTGVSALVYSALNLAGGSNYITGILPTGNQAVQTMGGDVSGTTASATVAKVNATTITTAGGALTTGTVLRVTGAASADWGALDLANASAVTGALPIGNIAPSGTNGQALITTAGVAAWGTDFGAQTLTTTGQIVVNVSGAVVRLGLAAGSGAGEIGRAHV